MANTWEDSKKKKNPIGLISILVVVLIIIGFLICNNLDIFSTGKKSQKTGEKTESVEEQSDDVPEDSVEASEEEGDEKDDPRKQKEPSSDTVDKKAETPKTAVPDVFSIDLPSILCSLSDKKGLSIRVSLKLYFKEKELESEILFKRDTIKLIVRKVFVTKHLSDIVVDALRTELQKEINALLEQGTVIDIEFLDFKPSEE